MAHKTLFLSLAILLAAPSIARAQDEPRPSAPDAPPPPAPAEATPVVVVPAPPSTASPQSAASQAGAPQPSAPANGDAPPNAPPGAAADAPPPPFAPSGHFEFGSYGRVRIASDGHGGTGRQANVVAHGTRIDEESYAELELRREDTFTPDVRSKVVATLALFPPFFHFSGDATQQLAVRNLFAQGSYKRWTMWVGSRMYRGDDIYLLDWWPLDNQNTVGGGAGVTLPDDDTILQAHVGMQRLDNAYQHQDIQVVAPFGVGPATVTKLDRPRLVETLKATHFFRRVRVRGMPKAGFKAILYGEAHELAAGTVRDTITNNADRPVPSDSGWLVGTQLGFWTGERDTHVNLFLRHARGVAAYDPLSVPTTFASDKTTSGSTETLVAIGANYERDMLGVVVGGYLRAFRDGDPSPTSTQKYDEGTLVVRPQVYIGEYFGVAVEGSFQERRLAVLDPKTNAPLAASALRGGIMPYFSPSGRGTYKRPQLRIIYAVTARNDGARALYPAEDVFASRKTEHFIGLGAEWWFNSSSYP